MKAYVKNFVVVGLGDNDSLFPDCVALEITEEQKAFVESCKLPKFVNNIFIEGYVEFIEVPTEISRMKFKIQIRRSTIYSYDIILTYLQNLYVNELFTQDDKDDLIDRLEDAVSFNRYHPDFINLANMLNISDSKKDEIFIEGNKIK